jgi:hypothetical protein
VCAVTTLAHAGPGSLQSCLDQAGPRTVVFRVSGVIEGPLEIKHGRLTIAGQTSPGGVTVKGGLVCDNVYDPNDCNDVVIRHLRLRGGAPDSLRLGGVHDAIVDHCSLAGADDENLELTRSTRVSVQYTMIAEPIGEHYKWGGVLINYSKDVMPLDALSLHHNVWNGVAGRLPELSCEENGDGPGRSNCSGHVARIELTSNLLWDASDPIWYNRCTGNNQGNDCPLGPQNFLLHLNLINNVIVRRSGADADAPLIEPAVWAAPGNQVHMSGNRMGIGSQTIPVNPPRPGPARHPFPLVSATPAEGLAAALLVAVGAMPRDPMDTRLTGYLRGSVDSRPPSWQREQGIDRGDAFFTGRGAPPPPPDKDNDGIPDEWEQRHGLDPSRPDGNDLGFAARGGARVPGCTAGYTALECYLNEPRP